MTSERLRRIIRSRWWVLALAGLLSVLAAGLAIQARNDAIPEHEAVAALQFNRLLGEVDDTLAQERLIAAEDIAVSVNASDLATGIDPLSPGVRAEVVARDSDLQLQFIGRGASPDAASSVATALRDRYLDGAQLDISVESAQRIADTATRLDSVLAAIASATDPPDLTDTEVASRLAELRAEVTTLAGLYAALTSELINPRNPPRPESTILAERDAASEQLRVAQGELLQLEFSVASATDNDVALALLHAEEAQLRAALDTYIAQSIIDEPIATVSPVEVTPSEILPTPLPVAVVVGLLVGLIVVIAGLVVVDRVRQPLWEPNELEPRFRLPEVPPRPRSLGDSQKPWYESAPEGRRKARIQELRSAVEGLPGFGDGVVVGVASLTGPSPNVHELAADLAAGLSSSGSWALLIDADYGQPSELPEFRRHNLELEDAVADPAGTIGKAAASADRDNDFVGVFIRERSADAADVLAQPAFARMLDAAEAMHDVVIVACPPTDSASYHVLTQRLDAMILVARAGDPTPAEVINALRTLEDRRSFPAGVVLISPRVSPVSLIEDKARRPPPTPDPIPVGQSHWQWSTQGEIPPRVSEADQELAGSSAAGTASAEAGDVAGEPEWSYRRAGPVRDGDQAAPVGSGVSGDQSLTDPSAAAGGGAQGSLWTERIKRRAFLKRSEDENTDDANIDDASPWLFRDGSA